MKDLNLNAGVPSRTAWTIPSFVFYLVLPFGHLAADSLGDMANELQQVEGGWQCLTWLEVLENQFGAAKLPFSVCAFLQRHTKQLVNGHF